ncbi:MDR family MFS transporter [Streptomyces tendae]|uniref:MDR family MFS transporter n=1 Tax=Streptomyces tendae TaxID=1932 RepID=UPI00371A7449
MTRTRAEGTLQTLRALPSEVLLLVVGVAINRMGNFVQIFLMLYLTRDAGYSASQAGLALTAYGVGAIVGVFTGGAMIDRIGARRAIVGSMAASGVLVAVIPLVAGSSYGVMLPVVCGAGASGQLYRPAATALLAELTPPDRLLMASAAMRLGLNTGAAVGPLLGSLLALQSYVLVFLTNAAASLAFACITWWIRLTTGTEPDGPAARNAPSRNPSAAPEPAKGPSPAPEPAKGRGYRPVLRDRPYLLFIAGTLLVAVAEVQYQTVLPLEVAERGEPDVVFASLVALNAALIIFFELPLTRALQRLPIHVTMAAGSLLIGLGIAMFGLPTGVWILVAGTLVWTFGEAVSAPPVSAYPAFAAPEQLRGRYIGLMTTSQSIGYAIGPGLGAALYSSRPSAVWLMCAGLGVGAAVLMWFGSRDGSPAGGTSAPSGTRRPEPPGARRDAQPEEGVDSPG